MHTTNLATDFLQNRPRKMKTKVETFTTLDQLAAKDAADSDSLHTENLSEDDSDEELNQHVEESSDDEHYNSDDKYDDELVDTV